VAESERERLFLDAARKRGLRVPGKSHLDVTLRGISSFFTRSFFREETARRDGLAQRVDPRARLIALLVYLVSVSAARSIPALLIHAALPVLAIALSRIRPSEFLGAGFMFAILFSVLMAAPSTLNVFYDGTVAYPLFSIGRGGAFGPYAIPGVVGITREGMMTAATFLLRVLSSTAAVLWLTMSTRWVDLLRALRFLRLPPLFLQVAGMTVRYLHAFLRQSEEIHLGKKSRAVCRSGIRKEHEWIGSRIAGSWEKSLHLMEEVGSAMRSRGFTGDARFPPSPWFRSREWAFIAIVAMLCAGGHLA
jgi:cobalt ECF transporter T component CbiQ